MTKLHQIREHTKTTFVDYRTQKSANRTQKSNKNRTQISAKQAVKQHR
jgi:hypothetical protein